MLKTRFTSSIEKVFADDVIESYPELKKLSCLKGEKVGLQFVYTYDNIDGIGPQLIWPRRCKPQLSGKLAEYVTIANVKQIPVTFPVFMGGHDDNVLRTKPGLFPDVIEPLHFDGSLSLASTCLLSAWVEIEIPENIESGEYELTIALDAENFGKSENTVKIEVINANLPEQTLYFTQWFHADCIAQYYDVDVWSEKHWAAVENFARVAVKNGINTLLTPVFTPPLDTAVGGERTTTQLVDVTVEGGKYSFDFKKLDRWVAMCDRVGIKYFEISHLYTQWGAAHAPKIMATVDGEYKKIFGWDTDSVGEEYKTFLRTFLTALIEHMKKNGNDKRCMFHISDEPSLEHLEKYQQAKNNIADLLADYTIMDALSNLEFYKTGAVDHPIPASNHVHDFIDANIEGLWTYYCVSQWKDVSNRFHSMPAWRNRSIGMQMFKYNIKGFLQWGYNFYNNQYSDSPINPYIEQASEYSFQAGDPFSVYPGPKGTCLESCRIKVFYEALQDMRAMQLCETLYSHGEVVAAIEETFGKEIKFDVCAKSADQMLAVREKINEMIKAKV